MTVYPLTTEWSEPIQLAARDMVRNQGGYAIEISAADPATDPARLLIPAQGRAIQEDNSTNIRARALVGGGALHLVRGF